uniref:Uncharacterized protein n=1 Tax=Meloidogyne hapla TaxID=6305 RepID=A0A1I8BSY4_MELHA
MEGRFIVEESSLCVVQIRGLQPPPPPPPPTSLSEISTTIIPQNKNNSSLKSTTGTPKINFIDILIGNNNRNIYNNNNGNSVKKKRERFSLLKFCTGRNITTQSSSECISTEDSVGVGGEDGGVGGEDEETCGLTTSNLDSILAEQTAIELANNSSDGGEFR